MFHFLHGWVLLGGRQVPAWDYWHWIWRTFGHGGPHRPPHLG